MVNYSIWLMEYARAKEQPSGSFFDGQYNQGIIEAPFCFGVLKNKDITILVDIGYDYTGHCKYLADISGCSLWQPIAKVLNKINITPEEIDAVLITHAHFDHIGGNLEKFPNAHFYIQREEYEKWQWALSLPEAFAWVKRPVDPLDILKIGELHNKKRLTLVEGTTKNILPEIDLIAALDTHSFGCQYVVIKDDNDKASWVFVGDNIYSYKNVINSSNNEIYTPIGFCQCSKVKTLISIAEIFNLVEKEPARLLISHEKETWVNYPSWIGEDGLHVAEINHHIDTKSYFPTI